MVDSKHKSMQCKGRYTKEKKALPFTTKSGYFTERRCKNNVIRDELCMTCIEKSAKKFVPVTQQTQFQGKVDEPYYSNSWIFGSARFKKYENLEGNLLSAKQRADAELAQRISRGDLEMKGAASKKKVVAETVAKKKETKKPVAPIIVAKAVEVAEPPLEAIEVITIQLHSKMIGDKSYWYDSTKDKVYEKVKDGSIGKYLGRYDSREQMLVSFPDSDVE